MGRANHLKETLPQNIRDNPISENLDIEFVVLNYNSSDDLHEWITTDPEMVKHIESGLVRYGKTTDPEFFYMSHAKNMVHRMATGDVVCNLDADNFLGEGFAEFLQRNFLDDLDIVINPSHRVSKYFPPDDRGFFGRVAISRDNFLKLNGYDESFSGWGGEDEDFMQRAKGLGLKHKRIDDIKYLSIIRHTNEERIVNMVSGDKKESELAKVNDMKNSKSPLISKLFNKLKVLAKPIQANSDGDFGIGNVEIYGSEKISLDKLQGRRMGHLNVCALGLPELVRGRIAPRIAEIDEIVHEGHEEYDLTR